MQHTICCSGSTLWLVAGCIDTVSSTNDFWLVQGLQFMGREPALLHSRPGLAAAWPANFVVYALHVGASRLGLV